MSKYLYKIATYYDTIDAVKEIQRNLGRDVEESRDMPLADLPVMPSRKPTSIPMPKAKLPFEKLHGGKADDMDDDEFDSKQLSKGISVEMEEHTDDPDEAEEIAEDHLTEDDEYYDWLEAMEDAMKEAGAK